MGPMGGTHCTALHCAAQYTVEHSLGLDGRDCLLSVCVSSMLAGRRWCGFEETEALPHMGDKAI